MADQSQQRAREIVLRWWAHHHQHTAAAVAAYFNGDGHDDLPEKARPIKTATLRQWKRRHGLPGTEPEDANGDGLELQPAAVWVDLATVRPWVDNPRDNDDAVHAVAQSIARFGYGRAFVGWRPDHQRMLVVGHTALKATLHLIEQRPVFDFQAEVPTGAAKKAKAECEVCDQPVGGRHRDECPIADIPDVPRQGFIPIRWRSDWTEAEARAYAIADNKLGELSGWVDEQLARQLKALQDDDGIAASLLGVSDAELADLMAGLEGGGGGSGDDDAPPIPLPVDPVSSLGEVYRLGPHRLVCGDSGDSEVWDRILDEGKALQAIVTDPPFGIDYEGKTAAKLKVLNDELTDDNLIAFLRRTIGAALGASRAGACFYVFGPQGDCNVQFVPVVFAFGARWCLVWAKDRFVLGRADYHLQHELIWYGWKPGAAHHRITDRTQSSRLDFPRPAASKEHPTIKPVELIARLVENSTKPGWLVGDGFGGSGTTLIACAMTGRLARLIELSPAYCDVIRQRWWRWATANDTDPGPDALPVKD